MQGQRLEILSTIVNPDHEFINMSSTEIREMLVILLLGRPKIYPTE